ncbi:MAG: NlpC/P60 family protein [Acidimicrobiales bacterium]
MTDTLSSVQGWASQVGSTLASLPAALQQAAPSGDFGSVLAGVQEMLAAGPAGTANAAGSLGAGTANAAGSLGAGFGSLLVAGSAAGATGGGALLGTSGTVGGTVGGAVAFGAGGTGGLGSAAVADAVQYLGVPYQWGGSTPAGFDCSGLVQYVYGQLGVTLPRTSQEQATVGTAVPSLAAAQPGDLVFFPGSDGTAASPGHVGIYVGNGEMIDAPYTGASVRIEPVGDPVAIRRVVPSGAEPAAAASGGTQVPADLAPLFASAAGQYGVPVGLLTAVAQHESGFDPNAVSPAGAEGLMQLMPGTAAGLGVNPFDPAQAIDGAAQLLSGYLRQYGSVPLALAAYNAGPGAVAQYGGIPPYPETQQYVSSIMAELGAVG